MFGSTVGFSGSNEEVEEKSRGERAVREGKRRNSREKKK